MADLIPEGACRIRDQGRRVSVDGVGEPRQFSSKNALGRRKSRALRYPLMLSQPTGSPSARGLSFL